MDTFVLSLFSLCALLAFSSGAGMRRLRGRFWLLSTGFSALLSPALGGERGLCCFDAGGTPALSDRGAELSRSGAWGTCNGGTCRDGRALYYYKH